MRRDKNGNLRELHVEKALRVLTPDVYSYKTENDGDNRGGKLIGRCEYFTTREYALSGEEVKLTVTDESFLMITTVKGGGVLNYTDDNGSEIKIELTAGDTYFAPAANDAFDVTLSGNATFITVEV
jgi:mannose-6-phosphate isomerase